MNFKAFLKEGISEGDKVTFQNKDFEVLEVKGRYLKLVDNEGKEITTVESDKITKKELTEDKEISKGFIVLNDFNKEMILSIIEKYTKSPDISVNLIEGIFSDYDNSKISEYKLIDAIDEECEYTNVEEKIIDKILEEVKLFISEKNKITEEEN